MKPFFAKLPPVCPARIPARPKPPRSGGSGFTLMEVNIALLVIALALMGLMALFHVGLRQSEAATSDNTQAAFANLVLNAMRANAQMVTNWTDWQQLTNGVNLGVAGTAPTTGGHIIYADSSTAWPIRLASGTPPTPIVIENYLVRNQHIEYLLHLEFTDPADQLILTACIQTSTRRYTDVGLTPKYATSFVYMGM